jgi:hypothetical protein
MNYITNFEKSRKKLIGSSDVPALIQHPEKAESLAGYDRTPLTVYQEKLGLIKREPAGLPAKLGNALEPYVLYEAIKELENKKVAQKFLEGRILTELTRTKDGYKNPEAQFTDYLHHTEAINSHSVSHADCINIKKGILIEAKTAGYWSANRRQNNPYDGYDTTLKSGQGIPLKHFMQVQHQCAIYKEVYGVDIKKIYVALITDGKFHMWQVKPDIKVQTRILELCSFMKICIDKKIPPKELAMNTEDIKVLYPEIKEDFKILSGEELQTAVDMARLQKEASEQEKAWKQKKEDANSALSIILKDTKMLKGIIDGEMTPIAEWQERKGGDNLRPLSEIKKNEEVYHYLSKNDLIVKADDSKFVKVKLK